MQDSKAKGNKAETTTRSKETNDKKRKRKEVTRIEVKMRGGNETKPCEDGTVANIFVCK